jgi:hypothetical protein
MIMSDTDNKLCPSSTCREGSILLGVVQQNQTITMLNIPLRVDATFVKKLEVQGAPEKKFRFTNKCIKSGCRQWDGSSCGALNFLAASNKHLEEDINLKPCIIRESCRWFHQEGKAACTICTFVVTNYMEESAV